MSQIKISFDFDQTLDKQSVQNYAKSLVDLGYEVWIVTRRYNSLDKYTKDFQDTYHIVDLKKEHTYLFEVATDIGIPLERIKFMNMEDKYLFFADEDFLWHLDDDRFELEDINALTNTKGISVYGNWKHKCNKLIDTFKFNNSL